MGRERKKSKSDVFLNHYTASVTLCVTLSLPPSAADCQMSTSSPPNSHQSDSAALWTNNRAAND